MTKQNCIITIINEGQAMIKQNNTIAIADEGQVMTNKTALL